MPARIVKLGPEYSSTLLIQKALIPGHSHRKHPIRYLSEPTAVRRELIASTRA